MLRGSRKDDAEVFEIWDRAAATAEVDLGLYFLVRVEPPTVDAVELASIFLAAEDNLQALHFKRGV